MKFKMFSNIEKLLKLSLNTKMSIFGWKILIEFGNSVQGR